MTAGGKNRRCGLTVGTPHYRSVRHLFQSVTLAFCGCPFPAPKSEVRGESLPGAKAAPRGPQFRNAAKFLLRPPRNSPDFTPVTPIDSRSGRTPAARSLRRRGPPIGPKKSSCSVSVACRSLDRKTSSRMRISGPAGTGLASRGAEEAGPDTGTRQERRMGGPRTPPADPPQGRAGPAGATRHRPEPLP